MFGPPEYAHTQSGWIRWLMYGVAGIELVALAFAYRDPLLRVLLPAMALLFVLMAFIFGELTVRDDCEDLVVEFGPLHLLRKRVAYAEMLGVSTGRTTFWEGWGIHYNRHGWLWNVSGFDCVQVDLKGNRKVRIGTDDPEKLCEFLRSRVKTEEGTGARG